MADSPKQILQKANAAILAGDVEGFLVHCTEDTEWTFVGERTLKGKAAVREWMAAAYQEPPSFQVERLIAEGDHVTALGEIMVKDAQGRPRRHAYCDVWRFRGDRMAELRAFVLPSDA